MESDKIYEIKKEIDVSSLMQLVDLNGTRINFQSDFIVSTNDPSKKVLVCIVNQEQLDQGDLQFEPTEDNGKYSRRITYQENEHMNHFIGIKKLPSDKTEENIPCTVIVRLTELKVEPIPMPEIDIKMKQELQEKLLSLSKSQEYHETPDVQQPQIVQQTQNVQSEQKTSNMYYTIGVTCLILFAVMIGIKFLRKK